MKKLIISSFVVLAAVIFASVVYAQESTNIRIRFKDFTRDKVYLAFTEQNELNMDFPYKAGQEIDYTVDLKGITMLRINTFVNVLLQPGDNIEVDIEYVERNYRNAVFKGSSDISVIASTLLNDIRAERLSRKYKVNIPAAIAVQTSADVFFKTTMDEWKLELAALEAKKDKLSPAVYTFLKSELDAIFVPNIIAYPDSDKQEGYWTALDIYKLRDDSISLSNFSYIALLQPYMQYKINKAAKVKNQKANRVSSLQERYKQIVAFYDGNLRDAALLIFLYSAMANNVDFEISESLYQDYLKNYNINQRYKQILTEIMN